MDDRVIVNVAVGSWFPYGQNRLCRTLDTWAPDVPRILWTNQYPPGSPTHKEVPYAFKLYALMEAVRRGHRRILWLDASLNAMASLDPLWKQLDEVGYVICDNPPFNCGTWGSDACAQYFNLTREEMFDYPMTMALCVGFNMDNQQARELFECWNKAAVDAVAFKGDWNNDRKQVSTDVRVKGHRHDQTCLSIIAKQLGLLEWMNWTTRNNHPVLYWPHPPEHLPSAIFLARGGEW